MRHRQQSNGRWQLRDIRDAFPERRPHSRSKLEVPLMAEYHL